MWHLFRRNRADLVAAQVFFRRAIEVDPSFATPHAALALSCFFQITHGFTTNQSVSLEGLFAESSQAVALDRHWGWPPWNAEIIWIRSQNIKSRCISIRTRLPGGERCFRRAKVLEQ
jgi:hypothetical protein